MYLIVSFFGNGGILTCLSSVKVGNTFFVSKTSLFSRARNSASALSRDSDKGIPSYNISFAFLTPDGAIPEKETDQQDWQPVSYTDILDAIRSARNGVTLSPEVGMLLDHYTEAVMKHITGDKDTERLCKEIYAKHRDILDLIFENCKTLRIVSCGIN